MKTCSMLISSLTLLPLVSNAIPTYTDRAAWESAVGSFADVDLAGQVADGATLFAGSDLNLLFGDTISFDQNLQGRQVPTSYHTWSNGNEPRVLFGTGTVVATFGSEIQSFGLEMQPDIEVSVFMTLRLSDGSIITQLIDGDAGAGFFGWVSDDPDHVVSMSLSSSGEDFAFGRMVQAGAPHSVPDDTSTGTLLLLGLAGLGAGVIRRDAIVS